MKPYQELILQSALDRVLKYAHKLAYARDDVELQRRGIYAALQSVAIQLEGLESAVRDYDTTVQLCLADAETDTTGETNK